jgi:hypothetical protein
MNLDPLPQHAYSHARNEYKSRRSVKVMWMPARMKILKVKNRVELYSSFSYVCFLSAAYTRALSTTLFTRGRKSDPEVDADQIVPLVLARAGAEKRAVEAGRADGDGLTTLIKVVEDGIAMVRQGKNACCLKSLIVTICTLQRRVVEIPASG